MEEKIKQCPEFPFFGASYPDAVSYTHLDVYKRQIHDINMDEIWKDIVGYEGLYQVSNMGRVRSKERIFESKGTGRCV